MTILERPAVQRIEIIGNAILILGDCQEIVLAGDELDGEFDSIITDPPYGIGAEGGVGRYGRMNHGGKDSGKSWDNVAPAAMIDRLLAMKLPTVIWGGHYFTLPPCRGLMIWDKGATFKGRDFAECEVAWCSIDRPARILKYDPSAKQDYRKGNKHHPTMKPLAVMDWSILALPASITTVLDPFMGSGSTGIAATRAGKAFIGIEKDPEYFERAVARFQADVDAPRLFQMDPAIDPGALPQMLIPGMEEA